jgi:hypothetical protein
MPTAPTDGATGEGRSETGSAGAAPQVALRLPFAAAGLAAAAGSALSAGGAGRLGAGRLGAHGRLGGGLGDLGDLGGSGGLGKGLGLGDVLDMPADGPGLEDPLHRSPRELTARMSHRPPWGRMVKVRCQPCTTAVAVFLARCIASIREQWASIAVLGNRIQEAEAGTSPRCTSCLFLGSRGPSRLPPRGSASARRPFGVCPRPGRKEHSVQSL